MTTTDVLAAAAPVGRHELWSVWGADPFAVVALLAAGWVYARGVQRIWAQVGRGRVVRPAQAVAGAAGLLVVFVALVSPLDALAHTLLSAHMVQHLLLVVVAAPLFVLATPTLPLLQGVSHRLRRPLARLHGRARGLRTWTQNPGWPVLVVGLHAAVTWTWHLPSVYQAALADSALHALEHLTLLGTAVLVWWTIAASGRRGVLGYGTGVFVVFLTGLQHAALGALLGFAPGVLYPAYADGAALWGSTALEDQHLAGVLMAVPGKFVHGAVIAVLVAAWLRDVDRRSRARDAAPERSPN